MQVSVSRAAPASFAAVPASVYRGCPHFVPPLLREEKKILSARHNPFLARNDHALFIARKSGRVAGRISAQLDAGYDAKYGKGCGFFGFLDAADDPQVTAALAETAEDWLADRGAREIAGPYHFNINQMCGLLLPPVRARPMIRTGYAGPWLAGHLEALGYSKQKDLVCMRHQTADSQAWQARFSRIFAGSPEAEAFRFLPLGARLYAQYEEPLRALYNRSYAQNWGAVDVGAEDSRFVRRLMRPLLDFPGSTMATDRETGKPLGLLVMLPDVDSLTGDLGGRLGPFNALRLGWRLYVRGAAAARIPVICVDPALRGTRLGAYCAAAMMDRALAAAREMNMHEVEISWMLEDNHAVLNLVRGLGAHTALTYRLYRKTL